MRLVAMLLSLMFIWGCSSNKTSSMGPHKNSDDKTPPHVIAVSPADGDTSQPSNALITATFSEDIDTTTLRPSTFCLNHNAAGTITYKDKIATFKPGPILLFENETYTATLSTGIKDLAGNALAAPYQWSFKTITPDLTRPTVVSTCPVDGDTLVPANSPISVTFSEEIDSSSVTSSSYYLSGAVKGSVTTSGKTIILTPSADLESKVSYTATAKATIADLSGNTLSTPYSWSFKTIPADRTPPSVIATIPSNGATNVSVDSAIRIVFSEGVDSSTLTAASFTVSDGVTGSISLAGDTAILVPSGPLLPLHTYTVSLSTAITDHSGNHLLNPYTFSFVTELVVIMPLAVGNMWVYSVSYQDTLHFYHYEDTILITRDTVIGGESWYVDQRGYHYANRSDGLYLLNNGQPVLALKFPANINDSFPSPFVIPGPPYEPIRNLVVQSTSQSVTVPKGTYTCIVYRTPDDPAFPAGYADYRYCPNVGLIQYYKDPSYAFDRFSDPRVNKVLTKAVIQSIGK